MAVRQTRRTHTASAFSIAQHEVGINTCVYLHVIVEPHFYKHRDEREKYGLYLWIVWFVYETSATVKSMLDTDLQGQNEAYGPVVFHRNSVIESVSPPCDLLHSVPTTYLGFCTNLVSHGL